MGLASRIAARRVTERAAAAAFPLRSVLVVVDTAPPARTVVPRNTSLLDLLADNVIPWESIDSALVTHDQWAQRPACADFWARRSREEA